MDDYTEIFTTDIFQDFFLISHEINVNTDSYNKNAYVSPTFSFFFFPVFWDRILLCAQTGFDPSTSTSWMLGF
jgi:hypothetical protein